MELGHLVVQRASGGVVQRVPVKAWGTVLLGVPRHPLEHCRRDTPPPNFWVHEEVRQIAFPAYQTLAWNK